MPTRPKPGHFDFLSSLLLVICPGGPRPRGRPAARGSLFDPQRGADWWGLPAGRAARGPRESAGRGGARNPIDAFLQAARAEVGLDAVARGRSGDPDPPRQLRPDRACRRRPRRSRRSSPTTGPTPTSGWSTACSPRPASASAGRGPGSTWPATPTRGASSSTTRGPTPGDIATGSSRALNDDMPYDRFVGLQLAADETRPRRARASCAALGFLRNGPSVGNQQNETIRMDELDDVVSTTVERLPRPDRRLRPLPRPQVRPDPDRGLLPPPGRLRPRQVRGRLRWPPGREVERHRAEGGLRARVGTARAQRVHGDRARGPRAARMPRSGRRCPTTGERRWSRAISGR